MMRFARRIWHLIRSRRIDRELAQEIDTHRALLRDDLERRGLTPEVADAASRRALGNTTLAREDAHHVWRWAALERLWQDVGYGARMLRRNPSFTGVAVMTLALGIGANTAMFSVVNAVLLRPLPFHDPDRLVAVWISNPKLNVHEAGTSYPTFVDWRSQSRTFADMAIVTTAAARVSDIAEPERDATAFVSANLFPILGVQPAIGRTFTADDEERRERVVVLSHALWQRLFGGDPNVLNMMLEVDGDTQMDQHQRLRIIGVMPEEFYFPAKDVRFWRPATLLGIDGKKKLYDHQFQNRFTDRWNVVARLAPGANVAEAQADLTVIGRRLTEAHPVPAGHAGFPGFGAEVVPLHQQLTGRNLTLAFWVLFGAVGFVLLIACANVANLLLARGTTRAREFAIRAALGAGRSRIVRQLCVESIMLAILAGAVGTVVATAGIRALAASTAVGIPRLTEISVDRAVLLFTAALSIAAGFLFGTIPAWRLSRTSESEPLKEQSSAVSSTLRIRHTRSLLLVGQCALAVVLLTGAGLLIRSFVQLQSVQPGFNPDGVLLVRLDLPIAISPTWREQEWTTFEEITNRVRQIPGVTAAGLVQNLMIASNPRTPITVEGQPFADETLWQIGVNVEDVTPGFFQAMGVPLKQGRFFDAGEQNADIAIVNETFVRRFLPDENPIGKRFSQGRAGGKMLWQTIVGVVGDMHRQGLERRPIPEFFIPSSEPAMDLAVRTTGDPAAIAAAVRHEIRSVYANAIIVRMTTLESLMGEWSAERRFQAWLLALFAAMALALASIGIYGVMQFAAAQRTKEMGIRIALGADGVDLLRLMIGQGVRLPLTGLAIGLLGAYLLVRVLQSSLFEISPTDPITFGGVAILLCATAVAACYLPARRAARVDPVVALRHE